MRSINPAETARHDPRFGRGIWRTELFDETISPKTSPLESKYMNRPPQEQVLLGYVRIPPHTKPYAVAITCWRFYMYVYT